MPETLRGGNVGGSSTQTVVGLDFWAHPFPYPPNEKGATNCIRGDCMASSALFRFDVPRV